MQKIRLAMIEDNKDLCNIVLYRFQTHRGDLFDIVGAAYNGKDGYALVSEKMPHVVLIDIVLPIQNGLSVLKKIKQNPLTKHIICVIVSAVDSEEILAQALELGADYYVIKPFDVEILIERIIYLYSALSKSSIFFTSKSNKNILIHGLSGERFALYALREIGVPMNLSGYSYLKSAIEMCISDGRLLDAVTKELYTKIGAEYRTTGSRVERCIRNAIERSWELGCGERYYEFIEGNAAKHNLEKPTNSSFIFSLVSLYNEYHTANT